MLSRKFLKLVLPRLTLEAALTEDYEAVKIMVGVQPPHTPAGSVLVSAC